MFNKRNKRLIFFLATISLFCAISFSAFGKSVKPGEAYSMEPGTKLTLSGLAACNTLEEGTGFENEFYLCLEGEAIAVLNENIPPLLYGQRVNATGTLQLHKGNLKLVATEVEALKEYETVQKKWLSVKEALDYEKNKGSYAQVYGKVTQRDFDDAFSSFVLSYGENSIRVILEETVSEGRKELYSKMTLGSTVTATGFVYSYNGETVLRAKSCEDFAVTTHHCNFSDWITEVPATCEKSGVKKKFCAVCGATIYEEILPKGHSYESSWRTVTQPGCTSEGLKELRCTACTHREYAKIEPLGHSLETQWKTEKEPTCSQEGLEILCCRRCDYYESRVLAIRDHKFVEGFTKAGFSSDGESFEECCFCKERQNQKVIYAVSRCSFATDSLTYSGEPQQPVLILEDRAGNKVEDYRLLWYDCTSVGRQKVVVELSGKYKGTKTLYYNIVPKTTDNITATIKSNTVTLSFDEVEFADSYRIYSVDEENGKESLLYTADKNKCKIKGLGYNKSYRLVIKACKETEDGKMISQGAPINVRTAPKKPSGIKATADFCSVTLSWKAPEGAVGYKLYIYDEKKKSYKSLGKTRKTQYTVTGLSAEKEYIFAIKPYGKYGGETLWSAYSTKTAATKTARVSTFKATAKEESVKLSWTKLSYATGYRVYVYNEKTKSYKRLATLSENSYTAKKLKSGKTYKFAVKPYIKKDGKNYWGKSYYLTVSTKLSKPVLTAKALKKGNSLSWKKVSGAEGYEIYYTYVRSDSYLELKSTKALSYKHSSAISGRTCYYKVRAYKTVDGQRIYSSFSTVQKAG